MVPDEIITIEANTELIYQHEKAQIDTQIATAKAFPRDIKQAVQDSIATVTMDYETAASCSYAVPRGGKTINGPSIHLALILAQNWGNLRISSKVTSIDGKSVTSRGVCFDLQKNIAIEQEVKRSIMSKNGRMSDDMITVTGNAANSISLRNAILKVIPKAVVDKVAQSAKNLILGDISDEAKFIIKINDYFNRIITTYGVTELEILASVGKPNKSTITPDNLVTLIGFAQSIKDGDATVETIFRPKQVNDKAKEEKVDSTKLKVKIAQAKTLEAINKLEKDIPADDTDLFTIFSDKKRELSNPTGNDSAPGKLL
ncbi:hypothetical protein [Flavobacterium sp. FlaQc-50]|uniref:hypothetical protein n=1 Tax=unclassified Flavobacterium TaxID=196869 RepID=UPI00375813D0